MDADTSTKATAAAAASTARAAAALTPERIDKLAAKAASICGRSLRQILGRYFECNWSHGEGHTLYDSAGRAAVSGSRSPPRFH